MQAIELVELYRHVHTHVHAYIHVYIHDCKSMHRHVHAYRHVCEYVCRHVCRYACRHVHRHVYGRTRAHACVHTHASEMDPFLHTWTYPHTRLNTGQHLHPHVYRLIGDICIDRCANIHTGTRKGMRRYRMCTGMQIHVCRQTCVNTCEQTSIRSRAMRSLPIRFSAVTPARTHARARMRIAKSMRCICACTHRLARV